MTLRLTGMAVVVLLVVFGAGYLTGRSHEAGGAGGDAAGTTPDSHLGDADRPVPLGADASLGAWTLTVVDVEREATEIVLATNQFNVGPPDGSTYLLVEVQLRRRGVGPAALSGSLTPALVVPSGTAFALGPDCGVLPEALDAQALVEEGEIVSGQWCWEIPQAHVDKAALRISGTGGGAVWFSLR